MKDKTTLSIIYTHRSPLKYSVCLNGRIGSKEFIEKHSIGMICDMFSPGFTFRIFLLFSYLKKILFDWLIEAGKSVIIALTCFLSDAPWIMKYDVKLVN